MDMTMEQFEDIVFNALDATKQSIAVWPEPTSPEAALKMFVERLFDDIGEASNA